MAFYVGAGADINLGPVVLTPTASLQFVHYDQEGFEETGAGPAGPGRLHGGV
ncbi:MAG: autotransporter domain-containing protein [Desulfococcaceae bacterium]